MLQPGKNERNGAGPDRGGNDGMHHHDDTESFITALREHKPDCIMFCDPKFPSSFNQLTFTDRDGHIHCLLQLIGDPETEEQSQQISDLLDDSGVIRGAGTIVREPHTNLLMYIFSSEQALGGAEDRAAYRKATFDAWIEVCQKLEPDGTSGFFIPSSNSMDDGGVLCVTKGNIRYVTKVDGNEGNSYSEATKRLTNIKFSNLNWVAQYWNSKLIR